MFFIKKIFQVVFPGVFRVCLVLILGRFTPFGAEEPFDDVLKLGHSDVMVVVPGCVL